MSCRPSDDGNRNCKQKSFRGSLVGCPTDRLTQGTSTSHCALCIVTVAWVGVKEAGLESPNSLELYLVCLVDSEDLQSLDTHTNT